MLANEEVVEGVCERCGAPVIRKEKSQWMLKITEYAQKLIDGLDTVDFIDRVKTQQRNWIGRSTGAEVVFKATTGEDIKVFTTLPDTLFGATYMVLSPEHALVRGWLESGKLKNADEVVSYQKAAASKSDLERTELNKEKTGVELDGVRGVNPVNGKEIPIFISDYVLSTYGTGPLGHGVGLALGRAAAAGAGGVHPVGHLGDGGLAVVGGLIALHLGQQQGQLILRYGLPAALFAPDHGDVLTPVALA